MRIAALSARIATPNPDGAQGGSFGLFLPAVPPQALATGSATVMGLHQDSSARSNLAVVNAAAFALARARMWRWLAIVAVVFGLLWTLPGLEDSQVDGLGAHVFHVLIGFVLAAALMVAGAAWRVMREERRLQRRRRVADSNSIDAGDEGVTQD